MRLSFALLLLGLSVTGSGCALVEDAHRTICVAIKTPLENHREMERNRQWADCAWMRVQTPEGSLGYSEDYASGFKEGYAEYLFRGGDGQPPVMAPLRYRKLRYQTPDGYQLIQDWFHGYRHGATVARDSGARDWIVGPTALQFGHDTVAHHVPALAPVVPPGIVPHMAPRMMPTPAPENQLEVIPLSPPRTMPRPLPQAPPPEQPIDTTPLSAPRIVVPMQEEPIIEPVRNGFNVGLSAPPAYMPALPPQARFGIPRGDERKLTPSDAAPNWTTPPLRIRFKTPDTEGVMPALAPIAQAPSLQAAKIRLQPIEKPPPLVVPEFSEPTPLPAINVLPEFGPLAPNVDPAPVPKPGSEPIVLPEFNKLPAFKPLPETAPEPMPKGTAVPAISPPVLPPLPPSEVMIIQSGTPHLKNPEPARHTPMTSEPRSPVVIQKTPALPGVPTRVPHYREPQVLIWGNAPEPPAPPPIPLGPPQPSRPQER